MSKWQEAVAEFRGDVDDGMLNRFESTLKTQCGEWGNKYAVILGITGIADAYVSLKMSKRSYTPEVMVNAYEAERLFNETGECSEFMNTMCTALVKWGIKGHDDSCKIDAGHETLLKYIDFTILVTEIHRGAMDDFDSHAGSRMWNRIIRTSTRLAKFIRGEGYSEWYKDKIIHLIDAIDNIPTRITKNGFNYVLGEFGYIREDLVNNHDVQRGTYPMSIPASCLCKINLHDLRHIYKRRNENTHAAPELRMMIEELSRTADKLLPKPMQKVISHDWALVNGVPGWHPIHDVYKVSNPNTNKDPIKAVDIKQLMRTAAGGYLFTDIDKTTLNYGPADNKTRNARGEDKCSLVDKNNTMTKDFKEGSSFTACCTAIADILRKHTHDIDIAEALSSMLLWRVGTRDADIESAMVATSALDRSVIEFSKIDAVVTGFKTSYGGDDLYHYLTKLQETHPKTAHRLMYMDDVSKKIWHDLAVVSSQYKHRKIAKKLTDGTVFENNVDIIDVIAKFLADNRPYRDDEAVLGNVDDKPFEMLLTRNLAKRLEWVLNFNRVKRQAVYNALFDIDGEHFRTTWLTVLGTIML